MVARVLLPVLILLILAGCGGGGGTAVPPPAVPTPAVPPQSGDGPPTVPPPAECVPLHDGSCPPDDQIAARAKALAGEYAGHANYRNQWGLDSINAATAYGHLELLKGRSAEPGAGVTIGFIDSGIDTAHPAFAGKRVTERFLDGASDETGTDVFSHGTAVAGVAAAVRSTSSIAAHGVAWGADIAMFAVPVRPGGGDYVPVSIAGPSDLDDRWARLAHEVLAWRDGDRKVDFLNLSLGYKGIIDNYGEREIRDSLGDAIAAMAQEGVGDKTVFVWAAGNAHDDPCDSAGLPQCVNGRVNAVSVELLPGLAARIPELRDHTLAVVALRPGDEADGIPESIAGFSNRCGIAADYCIAAPGEGVRGAFFGPDRYASPGTAVRGYADLAGTSVAAPMVTGGLALMKQLFRDQLSNTALVARLLETADNRGRYSSRAVYGRGKMDLGAATSPVGVLSVPATGAAAGPNARLGSTRLRSGSALGDSLARSLAGTEIMALDGLGAPFWFRLGGLAPAAAAPAVGARLRGFLAPAAGWQSPMAGARLVAGRAGPRRRGGLSWLRAGFLETPAHAGGGHLALARGAFAAAFAGRDGLTALAFTTRGASTPAPATGAALAWRPADSPLGVRAGWTGEPRALLGSVGQGAFGDLAANTAFVGVEGRAAAGRWRVGADAEFGAVRPRTGAGVIARMSPITTSAFALHAATAPAGWGAVRLSVSQPLRVERGRAQLAVPAARTKAGAVLHRAVRADLAPSGRQVDVAGQWSRPLAGGELRLGGVWSYRPGHAREADPEVAVMAGWRRGF